jgi:predicted kinase
MNQFLLILRGIPASGKSTIAKNFRNFERKVVWLKTDNFKEFFAEDSSAALYEVNNSSLTILDYYLSKGYSVIMDGVFQDSSVIDRAMSIAHEKHIRALIYVLTCSLSTSIQRDNNRPGVKEGVRKPLGIETMERIYAVVNNSSHPLAMKLDTEKVSIEECTKLIENRLKIA